MRKLYAVLLPILAVVAFASMSAAAQANTTLYGTCVSEKGHAKEVPCNAEEKFEAFGTSRVAVIDKKVSAKFELAAGTENIKCTGFQSSGFFWNEGGVGKSRETLVFENCTAEGTVLGADCTVANPINGNGIIEGVIINEVEPLGEKVKITIESGFGVKRGTNNFGGVTGSATGSQPAGKAVLTFSAATGLTFATKASTITGEAETETVGTKKKVFIN